MERDISDTRSQFRPGESLSPPGRGEGEGSSDARVAAGAGFRTRTATSQPASLYATSAGQEDPSANRTRSFITKLAPMMMPPSIWLRAPSGEITSPASAAHHTRLSRTSSSTSTSATTAANEAIFL
jgi:hypothetical protein